MAGQGRARLPARPDAGGDRGELTLAAPPRYGLEVGPAAGLGRARRAHVRPGAGLRSAARPRRVARSRLSLGPVRDARPGHVRRRAPATMSWRWAARSRSRSGPAVRSSSATGRPRPRISIMHLSTLVPPVRLRGYLEVRYLDMSAPRWWPAIAAVTTRMDDPVAADLATEATEPAAYWWIKAARHGLPPRWPSARPAVWRSPPAVFRPELRPGGGRPR